MPSATTGLPAAAMPASLADAHERLTHHLANLAAMRPFGFDVVEAVRASPEGLRLDALREQLQAAGGVSFDPQAFDAIASGVDIHETVLQLGSVVNALKLTAGKKRKRQVDSSVIIRTVAANDVVPFIVPPRGTQRIHIACRVCGRVVNGRSEMINHVRTHTGARPLLCRYAGCNKRFSHSSNLRQHERSHVKAKPYQCHYEGCNKGFAHSTSLKEHLFKHQGVRPYKCEHPGCTKAFDSMSNFNRHVRLHQKNEVGNGLVDVHMEGGSSKKQRTMAMAMPKSVPMLPVPMPASMHLNTAHLLRTIKPEPTNPQLSPKSQLLAQAQALTPPPTQGAGVFSSSLSSSSAGGSSRACMKLSPSCSPQPSFGTATAGGINCSSSISSINSSSSSSTENIHPNTGTFAGTSTTSTTSTSTSSSGLGALGALLPVVPMERQVSIDFNALGIDLSAIDMGVGIDSMGGMGVGSGCGGCGGSGNLSIGDAYLSSLSSELDDMASAAAAEKEKENPGPATIPAGAPAAAQVAALCG